MRQVRRPISVPSASHTVLQWPSQPNKSIQPRIGPKSVTRAGVTVSDPTQSQTLESSRLGLGDRARRVVLTTQLRSGGKHHLRSPKPVAQALRQGRPSPPVSTLAFVPLRPSFEFQAPEPAHRTLGSLRLSLKPNSNRTGVDLRTESTPVQLKPSSKPSLGPTASNEHSETRESPLS